MSEGITKEGERVKGHVIPIPSDPKLGKMDKYTLTFPRHLIVEKMLVSPCSVKHMLQNSVSATKRCTRLESAVAKDF